MDDVLYTPSGVRLRLRHRRPGALNWLLLPGGPGIGSESLHELADTLEVPGAVWMVDLPGDGSNISPPGVSPDPFDSWPGVLIEALDALPDCVYFGHSTGGMYLLATPGIEDRLAGLVLVSTAPDAGWRPRFVEMTQQNPIPAFDEANALYERERTDATLAGMAIASAPWNFTAASLEAGRDLLERMPYNEAAVAWSDVNFDDTYVAAWWPATLPTLIVSGAQDRIVWQGAWDAPRFQGANVMARTIEGGAHFPWIENPEAVRRAFAEFAVIVGA